MISVLFIKKGATAPLSRVPKIYGDSSKMRSLSQIKEMDFVPRQLRTSNILNQVVGEIGKWFVENHFEL